MKKLLFLFLILYLNLSFSNAQKETPESIFKDAEYFFAREDYEEAAYLFLKLLAQQPEHANFNFLAGMSFLNIPGQELKAIPYLEKAAQKTSLSYKQRSFQEKNAPHHTYFYLGNAYRINNELEKALESYQKFKDIKNFEKKYNVRITDNEIESCSRAKIIKDTPLNLILTNSGDLINSGKSNYAPVLTPDESVMIFMSSLTFYEAIMQSVKVNGKWTQPVNITPQIGSDGDMIPTSLSPDGNELYLVKKDKINSDIYMSRWNGTSWIQAEPLNSNINSRVHETFASVSPDGKSLYFTSNRRGSLGGTDIYVSKKQADGEWGKAENLGPAINTEFDEDSPYLSPDGKTLYFSSKGHFNMGGFDVFYSKLDKNGRFTKVVNIGFPINTTNDNTGYFPLYDGSKAYMAMTNTEKATGSKDIYRLEILPFVAPETFKESRFRKNFVITLTDKKDGTKISVFYNNETDQFEILNSEDKDYTISVSDPDPN